MHTYRDRGNIIFQQQVPLSNATLKDSVFLKSQFISFFYFKFKERKQSEARSQIRNANKTINTYFLFKFFKRMVNTRGI